MIDFSFVGKEGLIIQFEDIVSMVGFNIARYFKLKGVESLKDITLEDMILKYVNREEEDYNKWVKELSGINVDISSYIDSVNAFYPSWLYAYKVFKVAYDNGLHKLMIHSNVQIPFIEKQIIPTFNNPDVKYVYGDIIPIINDNPNITYLTSLPTNIRKCLDVKVPFALTIVDDYMYTADVLLENIPDELKKHDVFVSYTGIFSSVFIDNLK